MENYLAAYEEPLSGHPLADFIRNDLADPFREKLNTDKYLVSGNSGMGKWPIVPSLRISNKEITTSSEKGYYIIYLFKEDMTGVYYR